METIKKHSVSIVLAFLAILLEAIFNLESYSLFFVAAVLIVWQIENSRNKKNTDEKIQK